MTLKTLVRQNSSAILLERQRINASADKSPATLTKHRKSCQICRLTSNFTTASRRCCFSASVVCALKDTYAFVNVKSTRGARKKQTRSMRVWTITRSSVNAEEPRDALRQLKYGRFWQSYWKQNRDDWGHSVEIRQWKWTQPKWPSRSQYVTGNDAIW